MPYQLFQLLLYATAERSLHKIRNGKGKSIPRKLQGVTSRKQSIASFTSEQWTLCLEAAPGGAAAAVPAPPDPQ